MIERDKKMTKRGPGRPKVAPELRCVTVTMRLPQWLKDELDQLPDSRGNIVEDALIKRYRLKPPKLN